MAAKKSKKKTAQQSRPGKVQFAARISEDVLQQARAAVYWTPGLTLSEFVEEALKREVARLEKERGEHFPPHGKQLRAGRPVT